MSADRHAAGQARSVWPPEAGFFKLRLVSKGWHVPARIVCSEGRWHAVIDEAIQESHPDPVHAPEVSRVWSYGAAIDEAEYFHLISLKAWAKANDTAHPALHPQKPVNRMLLRPLAPQPRTAHS